MEQVTSAATTPPQTATFGARFFSAILRTLKNYLGAGPFGLRSDLLYLWATFRLRYRPIKMLFIITALGLACAAWEYLGRQYITPRLLVILNPIKVQRLHTVLASTAQAMFSSLNILSCISVFIIARTLRHLLKQGHLEMLQLVPARIRPSALFYAVSTRYVPLAFAAILVIYLDKDPRANPFKRPPFLPLPSPQPAPGDMWPVYWAGVLEVTVYLFCVTNLYMDMVIGFWFFNRFRVSYPTIMVAVIVIGILEPIVLMYINDIVIDHIEREITLEQRGIFGDIARTIKPSQMSYITVQDVAISFHYFITSVLSGALGLLLLGNLDDRWDRMQLSEKKDPILLKPID